MSDEKTFTEQQMREIIERQQLIAALEHSIQMGKVHGDSPQFINPLVNLYNILVTPRPPEPEKPKEPEPE